MAIQLHGVEKTTAHNAQVLTVESLRARMGKGFASSLERRGDRNHIPNNPSSGFTPPAAPASDPRPLLSATVHMSQCTQR